MQGQIWDSVAKLQTWQPRLCRCETRRGVLSDGKAEESGMIGVAMGRFEIDVGPKASGSCWLHAETSCLGAAQAWLSFGLQGG